jgi:hypothetical protein
VVPYIATLAAIAVPYAVLYYSHINLYGAIAAVPYIIAQAALVYPAKFISDARVICALHANAAIITAAITDFMLEKKFDLFRMIAVVGIGVSIGIALFCEDLQELCRWTSVTGSKKQKNLSRIESNQSLLNEYFRESFDQLEDEKFSVTPEESPKRSATGFQVFLSCALVIISGALHSLKVLPFVFHLKSLASFDGVGVFGKLCLYIAPFVFALTFYFLILHFISRRFCTVYPNEQRSYLAWKHYFIWFCRGLVSSSALICLLGAIYSFVDGSWGIVFGNTLKGIRAIFFFFAAFALAIGSASYLILTSHAI